MPLTSPANPLPLPQVGSKHILWRCFGYLRPYWRITVGAYLTLFGITGLSLAIPQLIRWIVDAGIGGRDVGLLGQAVLALPGLTLVRGCWCCCKAAGPRPLRRG